MKEENDYTNANGSMMEVIAAQADVSSDESSFSNNIENLLCIKSDSHQSRDSSDNNNRVEEKPSFSNIVDRRDRKVIPLFFERASGNIFNPSFDSEILENEFQNFSVSVDKNRFQIALVYIAFTGLVLAVFFGCSHNDDVVEMTVGSAAVAIVALILFVVTRYVKLYSKPNEARLLSIIVSVLYAVAEWVLFFQVKEQNFNYSARFGIATCIITVIYTMMPALPLYGSLILAVVFSVGHELIASFQAENTRTLSRIAIVILLHICIHLLCVTMVFMAQIRKRSTFWRIGQSVVAKQDLDIEQRVKDRMIRSVMPKKVADFLIINGLKQKRDGNTKQRRVAFRPFTMYKMENVSILFADIVGFTRMSAKKEADHLVHLLNMLFGKFDELTEANNCEKISTLGDCYYCVAGCPEYSKYHAISCIEMGLDIVVQIKKFCKETGEDVDMRVGIHTGMVLCGIVGDRRRRFDVWSNDVSLANKMESAGKPGRVHFTEKTLRFLDDHYLYEDGEGIQLPQGAFLKSYFVTGRANNDDGFKPWQKEGEINKENFDDNSDNARTYGGNLSNAFDMLDPQQNKQWRSVAIDHEEVKFSVNSPNHFKIGSDSIEKDFLNKATFPTPLSPSGHNIQRQLVKTPLPFQKLSAAFNVTYGITLNDALMRDAMRASNDNQLVRLMHEKKIQKEYFFNPPLHWLSLKFLNEDNTKDDRKNVSNNSVNEDEYEGQLKQNNKEQPENIEAKYREEGMKGFKLNPKVTTFASPKVHFCFDVLTAIITIIIQVISCCLYLHTDTFPLSFIVLAPLCLVIMLILCVMQVMRFFPKKFPNQICSCTSQPDQESCDTVSTDDPNIIALHDMRNHDYEKPMPSNPFAILKRKLCSQWVIAHTCGGIILCLPMILLFSMYRNCEGDYWDVEYFSMFMFVSLLYFCSFTQLSSLMKSFLAFIWCLAFVLLLLINPRNSCSNQSIQIDGNLVNDIAVVVILQIILIAVLNRIHDIGVRVNFYGDKEAAEQKNVALEQKLVADWLIRDMFPTHVSEQLKSTKNCSKNYEMVGVLFATIVNFHEFYEEHFEGGMECIRILHELVADFDKELEKFDDIEKIKTVYGTTFMAASGLQIDTKKNKYVDKQTNPHKYLHLKSLVDFALSLQRTLNEFNENMLGFRFRLRCGLNAGPVTAGVIGTMKPQYDIWGDTVNLSSRMDSLGVPDKIQVDEVCMTKLVDFYTFELRGTIAVKGKSDMATYFITGRKDDNGKLSKIGT